MKRPGHQGGPTELPTAVSNPIRRRVLRRLRADQRPHSSIELSETLGEPLSRIAYHMKVLQNCGAARLVRCQPVGSATVRFYEPPACEDDKVVAHLAATEAGDEGWHR
jgi:DNA-binding transcriptional ArsR family regulator